MWSVIKTQGRGEILQPGDGGLVDLHWHPDSGMDNEVLHMDKGGPDHHFVLVDDPNSRTKNNGLTPVITRTQRPGVKYCREKMEVFPSYECLMPVANTTGRLCPSDIIRTQGREVWHCTLEEDCFKWVYSIRELKVKITNW